jgi:cytochrome c peroxidase
MFSDFRHHVIGVPQSVPAFGNVVFDGPGANEDFGLEQVTGNPDDRYLFRTAPLRNAAVMPAFMHNGVFVHLEDAIRHHLDPSTSAHQYTPRDQLSDEEFCQLVDFVRHGLLDPRILPRRLKPLVPKRVPSGSPTLDFEFE